MYYVGIDIGGTNLKAGLVDEKYQLVATKKMPLHFVSMEQMWDSLFERQAITFEEWVSGLTNNSKYNKSKLEEIIKKRKEKEREMALIQQ